MTKAIKWILSVHFCVSLCAGPVTINLMSGPPPSLPGYPGLWRVQELQGEITVLVSFGEGGHVESVKLKSSTLISKWSDPDLAINDQDVFRVVGEQIKHWETGITSIPVQEVTIVFRIDPSLPDRQIKYLLNYGKFGIITRLEIVAAPSPK